MSRRRHKRPGRKLLGLDLGERRIGVAITDDTGILASPLTTIDLRHSDLSRVAEIVHERRVEGIIAGLPTSLSGDEGFQAKRAREMGDQIQAMVDVPLIYWDERLTSAIADQVLAGRSRSKRRNETKGERDAIAAAVLLQDYLETHREAQ